MDDKEITAALVQDEELGYRMLLERYTAYVSAILSGMAKGRLSSGDLEELAADVFFQIWRKRETLRPQSLKAYIAQTARNAGIDRLRKAGAELLPYEDDVLCITRAEQPDELAIVREQKQIIEKTVEELGEPEREIFIRFYYFGEKIKTIAQRLGLNAATAKTKLHRTRAVLKETLLERGYGFE